MYDSSDRVETSISPLDNNERRRRERADHADTRQQEDRRQQHHRPVSAAGLRRQTLAQLRHAGHATQPEADRRRTRRSHRRQNRSLHNVRLEQLRTRRKVTNTIHPYDFLLSSCYRDLFVLYRRVMIIMDVTVIATGNELGMKIGNPQPWQEGGSSAAPTAPAPVASKSTPAPRSTPNVSVNSTNSTQLSSQTIHPIAALSPYQNK